MKSRGEAASRSFVAIAFAAFAACGGSREQSPPKAPASPASTPSSDAERRPLSAEPSPASAPAAGAMAPPAAPPQTSQPAREEAEAPPSMPAQVSAEMKKAEHDVEAGDCPTACRALGSMERAVVFLCAGNQSRDDADRCDNARHHLASARRRIRTTCGTCPGGPSVDPDAPIPSR